MLADFEFYIVFSFYF